MTYCKSKKNMNFLCFFQIMFSSASNTDYNEDITRERRKCTFDTIELTHCLDGGHEKTKERKELGKLLT